MKKKIIFYSGHCEIVGGDAKYILELVSNLNTNDYDFKIYSDINPAFEKRAKQWLTKDISINYIDTLPRLLQTKDKYNLRSTLKKHSLIHNFLSFILFWFPILKLIRKLRKFMLFENYRENKHNIKVFEKIFKEESPVEIFHFNNGGYPAKIAGLMGIKAAKKCGVQKTIMTIQNLPAPKNKFSLNEHMIDKMIISNCDTIIPVADKLRENLVKKRGFNPNKIKTIYHGLYDRESLSIKERIIKREELGIANNIPLLIIVSNLAEDRKGHFYLFKAISEVKKVVSNIKLLVVGGGVKKHEFEKLAKDLNLIKHITFLGHRNDIGELNDICDIAIVPSIEYEGIPYTIREAMRSSKPVITTKAGGCDEAIQDGINGRIVKEKCFKELTESILELINDDDKREAFGKKGREIFVEKFLFSEMIIKHEVIYQEK